MKLFTGSLLKVEICVFLILLPVVFAFGQAGKLSGVVTDAGNGEPLPGVNVLISGTNMGGATDEDGRYFTQRGIQQPANSDG
ncbi:MAG: carboxypeptidase-like regulatory domain-containing protein [Calditrichota bacterium]